MSKKSPNTYNVRSFYNDAQEYLRSKDLLPKSIKELGATAILGTGIGVAAVLGIENADHVPVTPYDTSSSVSETSTTLPEERPVPVETMTEVPYPVETSVRHYVNEPSEFQQPPYQETP